RLLKGFQIMKWKQTFSLIIAASTLSALSSIHKAAAVVVVQNGQARASIVVPQNATPQIQQAAQTLQKYLEQSSGAKLPISTTAANGNAIHIGQTDAAKKAKIEFAQLDEDGFILQGTDDKNYVIVGGSDWGT